MAETEEWVQQDGEWQCVNCQVIFPEGKPWGYDYENSLVEVLPEELHDVPFWQERKYCTCCWDAWEEGYEEAVRLRHNADVLTQQMQAEAAPPAEAPSAAPAAAPAAEAPAVVPLEFVAAVPIDPPRGFTHSKKVKLANGELTFEEAFPYVCTDSVCVPKPRDMNLKDGRPWNCDQDLRTTNGASGGDALPVQARAGKFACLQHVPAVAFEPLCAHCTGAAHPPQPPRQRHTVLVRTLQHLDQECPAASHCLRPSSRTWDREAQHVA
jgi:hypothetical protein